MTSGKLLSIFCTTLFATLLACNATHAESTQYPFPTTAPSAPRPDPNFHVDPKTTIEYLASDELEGRLIGTPGLQRAADMIASDFSKLGLQTVPGLRGYFQPFEMTTSVDPDAPKTPLAAGEKTFSLQKDFMPLRFSAEKQGSGGVVFAGYGEANMENNYIDYEGIDVKGKIVLVMRFDPQDPNTGKSRFANKDQEYSSHAALQDKVNTAVHLGAAGVIFVNPPINHANEGMLPFGRAAGSSAPIPVVQVSTQTADEILKLGGAPDLKTLESQIDQSGKPDPIELKNVTVKMSVAFQRTQKSVQNVAAMLAGKGPHADEYVVVGAHYDHLGHGGPNSLAPWSHAIHHGADDNGSGTTAMLAIADKFAHAGPQARSVIFIAFTGEEEGLIGSEYFVNHPPVPLEKVAAMLNLDMVGRISSDKLLIGGMGTAADFPDLLKKADETVGLKLGEFGKGGVGPSDHMSFAMKKIPVLFFYDQMMIDYHRPSDTADKINFKGLEEVADLGYRVATAMATMPRQPYNSSYDAQGLSQMSVGYGSKAALGVVPDYSQGEEGTGGVKISGTVAGSAAEKAGLKANDVIFQFGDKKLENLIDLTNALGAAKPGQKIKLGVMRDGKRVEMEATLTERK
jgi:Zn-dependent M28 family amino/carboxypeptidase